MTDYEACHKALALTELSDHAVVEVTGEDSRKFLNGVLTNNIKTLQNKDFCYSCLCTKFGKVVVDMWCYYEDDVFFLIVRENLKAKLLESLDRYIITENVSLNALSDVLKGAIFLGPKAKTYIAENKISAKIVMEKEQGGVTWIEMWDSPEKMAHVIKNANCLKASAETLEILRIESGQAKYGVDMTEENLPEEANLHHALSFNKGCYIGQETIARQHNLGHVNKQLVLFKVESEKLLAPGEKIILEDKEIGWVTSRCISPKYGSQLVMGYIKYAFLNAKRASTATASRLIRIFDVKPSAS